MKSVLSRFARLSKVGELNFKVGDGVFVDVALDDDIGAREPDADFSRSAGKGQGAPIDEGLVAAKPWLGIDRSEIDPVNEG